MKVFEVILVLAVIVNSSAMSADIREREPDPAKAAGKVYEWHSKDGLAYHYFIPRDYDPEKGANLTFILHGSNLTRTWGFANHKAGEFRPNDIVVCPDGTTSNGQGGFNFMGKPEDAARLHALHEELGDLFRINATFLYGHSQGSFFALYYAGEYPEAVQGVVAHASGVWTWTKRRPEAHHQAIVLMHGTADPVVPFGQSRGGVSAFEKSGYSLVRLRALEGWNHWPAEHNGPIPHTSQQLAWVEGMTTGDMARLGACYAVLSKPPDKALHDYAGLYLLSRRIAGMADAPPRAKQAAAAAMKDVENLAGQHIAEMKSPSPGQAEFGDFSWIGHSQIFLRSFKGVPVADEFAETWKSELDKQRETVGKHFADYRKAVQAGNRGEAFEAGVAAIREGYLMSGCSDAGFLKNLAAWSEDRDLGISREDLKNGKALVDDYRKALEDGRKAFQSVNKRAKL